MNRPGILSRAGGLLVSSLPRGAFAALAAAAMFSGCKSTGVYANVGDVSAPVEISDSSDTINVRAIFSLTGAKVWSAKDSRVKITYTNCYTNVYFGVIDRRGIQRFGVDVNPTVDEAEEEGAEQVDGTTETAGTDAAAADSAQKSENCADGTCPTGTCADGSCTDSD